MSHPKERIEKNCLNCNANVAGRFCQICGQENTEPAESAWHITTHFFNDITHFDGKFFTSLNYLLFKPGFLSSEYRLGRRTSYLNPIRMYIFTSALFFLVFFSYTHVDLTTNKSHLSIENSGKETKKPASGSANNKNEKGISQFNSKSEYDSVQKRAVIKDNWLKRTIIYKVIEIKGKYHEDFKMIVQDFLNALLHYLPQMLFISLPLLALILKLLYLRRKQFYYTNHAIFVIHLYIVFFILLLAIILISEFQENHKYPFLDYLVGFLYFLMFFYEYKAMRNFYEQRRAKTLIKYLILNAALFFIILFLLIPFIFFSLVKL